MQFGQLLAGERRTKIRVVLTDDAQRKFCKAGQQLAITTQSTAAVGNQCQRPWTRNNAQADAGSDDPSGQVVAMQDVVVSLSSMTSCRIFEAVNFIHRKTLRTVCRHQSRPQPIKPWKTTIKRTSEISQRRTSQFSHYIICLPEVEMSPCFPILKCHFYCD